MEKEELVEAINEALNNRNRLDAETHREHHEYIKEWIEENRVKRERWEAIQRQVLGWGIIAFLSGIGTVVYNAIMRKH